MLQKYARGSMIVIVDSNFYVVKSGSCNFACGYCFQGDHGDYNKTADRMSPDTSERVAAWIESRLDELKPEQLTITFFGGEPLVNLLTDKRLGFPRRSTIAAIPSSASRASII